MAECKLCEQGDPAITVRCHSCRETFHLHRCQLDMVPDETIILGNCPSCGTVNCFKKLQNTLGYSGPVFYSGEPITDLRRKR